jgi:hypothetical protein
MTLRAFGILMLLLASLLSGATYSLSKNRPQLMAEASTVVANDMPADPVAKAEPAASDPPVRVILPSPYEIRTN